MGVSEEEIRKIILEQKELEKKEKEIEEKKKRGDLCGTMAIIFAILGIFLIAPLFVPLSFIALIVGILESIINKNKRGVILNIIALIINLFAISSSVLLLALFGV